MRTLSALVVAAALFLAPSAALAQIPFGGAIIVSIPCTCSATGQYIILGPPSIGAYVYEPVTVLFSFFNVYTPGTWLLGNYIPGHACLMGVTPYCYAPPAFGTIEMVGTS